ncbi:hypothetical protein [Citrobacter portucalensis]|uniref:hypothetical protein n=1 Tax=Citrobacter portucalensis TaxID=1639133 RepID=UPI00397DD0CD
MNGYEMEGFLRGNGIPGDLKVNESNAQYLVRKFSELQSQNADMAVQLANAESKCREMAAELSAVDKIHNEAVFITDDHYEQCPPGVQKMIRSLAVLQIPAYDAFLAEVRSSAKADGVQEYADSFRHAASKHRELHGETIRVKALLHEAENADKFAAQLRKGAAL